MSWMLAPALAVAAPAAAGPRDRVQARAVILREYPAAAGDARHRLEPRRHLPQRRGYRDDAGAPRPVVAAARDR